MARSDPAYWCTVSEEEDLPEALLSAVGLVAIRAAELGEAIDNAISRLTGHSAARSARLQFGQKLACAKRVAGKRLADLPGLQKAFVDLCDDCLALLPERHSAVHSTYFLVGGIIKWDSRKGPEPITVAELHATATRLQAATDRLHSLVLEIRNTRGSGIIPAKYSDP